MRPWHLPDRDRPWRDSIVFLAACPTCGSDAVWRGHKTGGPTGATDTTYDAIDCPACEHDWTARAQAARRRARIETARQFEEAAA